MKKWTFLFVIAIIAIIGIYALNSWIDNLQQEKALTNQQIINQSIESKFNETWARQNFFSNATIFHIVNLTEQEVKLLNQRTPMFAAILENQRTLIHNQYLFSKGLNVSAISNHTDNFDISNLTIRG